jgi:hypothetical protein
VDSEGLKQRKVPSKLVKSLKAWKAKADKNFDWYSRLLANPKLDFLVCLKACAERALAVRGPAFSVHQSAS